MAQTNIIGTLNLLSSVHKNGIKLDTFINLGTCEEYGSSSQPFNEQQVPDPVSVYSGTKAATSQLCRMFFNLYNIPVVTARPTLVYGPGQSDRFFITQAINKLMRNEDFDMTEGEQTRDFIFVADIVSALVELSKTPSLAGDVVNISSGVEYKLKEIVQKISLLTQSKSKINFGVIPYRQNEIMRYSADNSKLLSHTNWRPSVDLDEGLRRIIDSISNEQ